MSKAMDSDGTVIDIATVTSDLKGHFEYTWTPTNANTYKVMASFNGDDSYWGSWEETGLGVISVPSTSQPETIQTDYSILLYAILAAVIIAIVIGIIALVLSLRKR